MIAVLARAAALGDLQHQYSLLLSLRLAPFHQGPLAPGVDDLVPLVLRCSSVLLFDAARKAVGRGERKLLPWVVDDAVRKLRLLFLLTLCCTVCFILCPKVDLRR